MPDCNHFCKEYKNPILDWANIKTRTTSLVLVIAITAHCKGVCVLPIPTAGTAENPLFCLADVCKAVGLVNPSSVRQRLDSEDVQLLDLHALNYTEDNRVGNPLTNFVTESGFYDVILQSSSPNVKPFRKWVTSEVLPSIRKTGSYSIVNLSRKELAMMVIQAEEECVWN